MNSVATAVNFTVPEISWAALAPVLCVLCGGILAVLAESFVPVRARRASVFGIAVVALIASAVALVMRWAAVLGSPQSLGEYIEDPLTVAAQGILVLIAFFAVLVIADRSEAGDGAFAGQPSDRPGSSDEERSDSKGYQRSEMFALVLFSTGGMMIFPAANSYIALFVALEVMSLPLYILAATARRRRQLSQEAALKYFILGAFSSGFMLMGSAFLYGYSGSLLISNAATPTAQTAGMQILLLMGTVMVMVGLLFKVGAAPFHAWTPDVYTGAPTPVTGFMAAAVKLAAFASFLPGRGSTPAVEPYPDHGCCHHLDHAGGYFRRCRPDGRQAHAGLLLDRARGLHPHGCDLVAPLLRRTRSLLRSGLCGCNHRCFRGYYLGAFA